MKEKKYRIRLFCSCLFLCMFIGCAGNRVREKTISLENPAPKQVTLVGDEQLEKHIALETYSIDIPENAEVSTFCVHEDIVYYSVGYEAYFQDVTSPSEEKVFEDKYNTQIRAYHFFEETDSLIYEYEEEKSVNVTDMQCNGENLVWEDYGVDNKSFRIMSMELGKEIPVEIASSDNEEEMSTITLTITEEDLYWFSMESEEEHPIILMRYNFEEERSYVEEKSLDLASPYEHVNIQSDFLAAYRYADGNSIISIYDDSKNLEKEIMVEGSVSCPISNGKICVWMIENDFGIRQDIFIYNFVDNAFYVLNCDYVFAYGIVQDCIIINCGEEVYAYDVFACSSHRLTDTEDISYGFVFQKNSDYVYFEIWNRLEGKFSFGLVDSPEREADY